MVRENESVNPSDTHVIHCFPHYFLFYFGTNEVKISSTEGWQFQNCRCGSSLPQWTCVLKRKSPLTTVPGDFIIIMNHPSQSHKHILFPLENVYFLPNKLKWKKHTSWNKQLQMRNCMLKGWKNDLKVSERCRGFGMNINLSSCDLFSKVSWESDFTPSSVSF